MNDIDQTALEIARAFIPVDVVGQQRANLQVAIIEAIKKHANPKTLADVKPGGRVRLGDRQFEAWALSTGRTINDLRKLEGEYVYEDTRLMCAAWQAALSAQPSPAGQGDGLVESLVQVMNAKYDGMGYLPADVLGVLNMAVEALAARQPVGEPVGYFDPDVLAHLTEGLIDPVGVLRRKPNGKSNVPVWLGSPAQAVDLGQFRPAVELMEWQERGHANPDFPVGDPKKHAEALRLLALIDSQAVGK